MQTDADVEAGGDNMAQEAAVAGTRVAATGGETVGVVMLAFGEPSRPNREAVVDYLTQIFLANASLEAAETPAEERARSRELAERRAPSLLEEYEAIGGSPLNKQARAHGLALRTALGSRGYDVAVYLGTQFTRPTIEDAVAAARADDLDQLVGLPLYPLCGPSTTVASLKTLRDAVATMETWDPTVNEVTGWHRHPTYTRLRAGNVTALADERELDLTDDETALVFSAHGTPIHYLEAGSRYDTYVEEFCETMAAVLGVDNTHLGYQNHENRDVAWTEPDVESVIDGLDAARVVVDPVSFIHEQSETLAELDIDLRERAEGRGLAFHRVPVPHEDPALATTLADLVEPFVAGFDPDYHQLRPCHCREATDAVCLNAPR